MYDAHPLLHSIAEAARELVVIADATCEADEVVRLWKWADVIFMNNLCFDSEPVDAIHGTESLPCRRCCTVCVRMVQSSSHALW